MNLKNDNGLFVDQDTNTCVGYMFNFGNRGIFSPNEKVDVTSEQAELHNRLLSQGEIKGLDENCKVGEGGSFYYTNREVRTWNGEVVSTSILLNGNSITFQRKGKKFRGRLQKNADCFNFKRIS